MKIGDITATLVKKAVVNVIYKEWLHEGHIDIEHTEDFRCVIDGKLYEITVREVGNDIGTDYEAYKIALTALRPISREQVEKVWKGEWEWYDEEVGSPLEGIEREWGWQCSKCKVVLPDDFDDPDNPPAMRFCQWCGAPMTDEAVGMVMEKINNMEEMTNEH